MPLRDGVETEQRSHWKIFSVCYENSINSFTLEDVMQKAIILVHYNHRFIPLTRFLSHSTFSEGTSFANLHMVSSWFIKKSCLTNQCKNFRKDSTFKLRKSNKYVSIMSFFNEQTTRNDFRMSNFFSYWFLFILKNNNILNFDVI